MKIRLTFTFFICHFAFAYAQNINLDSVDQKLGLIKDDLQKVIALNKLSNKLNVIKEKEAALKYALDAKKISETKITGLSNDSLKQKFKSELGFAYVNIGEKYYNDLKTSKEAADNFNMALSLSKEISDDSLNTVVYNWLAVLNVAKGNYREAVEYFNKSFEIFERKGDEKAITNICLQLGLIYFNNTTTSEETHNGNQTLFNVSGETESRKIVQNSQLTEKFKLLVNKRIFAFENSRKADSLYIVNQIKSHDVEQQTKLKNVFVGGFSILAIMVFFLIRNIKQRKKINKELHETLVDLKGTQAQLVHQEKMASLGQLTSGIAHEIQNPLNFVNNFSEISYTLIDDAKEEANKEEREIILDTLLQNIKKVNHHGKRAQGVVNNMLLYSRSGHVDKQEINLNQFVEEILNLSNRSFQAKYQDFTCEIIKEYKAASPLVKVVPQDFSRMFLNLFNNAFYALQEKTKKNIPSYKPILKVTTYNREQKLYLKIYDNGIGIPVHIREKIYNPFFTTKPTGEGTGLGLGISYDIIKAHGGELQFKSNEGEYTEFEMSFKG